MFHLNRTIHQLKDGEARECDGKQRRKEYTSIYDVREFFSVFAALVPLRISVSVCVFRCGDVPKHMLSNAERDTTTTHPAS